MPRGGDRGGGRPSIWTTREMTTVTVPRYLAQDLKAIALMIDKQDPRIQAFLDREKDETALPDQQ